jgi:hypothetical protein
MFEGLSIPPAGVHIMGFGQHPESCCPDICSCFWGSWTREVKQKCLWIFGDAFGPAVKDMEAAAITAKLRPNRK